jgi:hypothetical protein
LPMTAWSPENRRMKSEWLMIATDVRSGCQSSCVNERPITLTPLSMSNKPGVDDIAETRSALLGRALGWGHHRSFSWEY